MTAVFNVYKFFCKKCGWMGDELEKSGCATYADEWFVCPKCKRDSSEAIEAISQNAALRESNDQDRMV